MANVINYILVPDCGSSLGLIDVPMSGTVHRVGRISAWPFMQGGTVDNTRPATGQQWPRGYGGGISLADLDALNDVDVSAPAANQLLVYDPGSGMWVNRQWKITHYNDSCTFLGSGTTDDCIITAVADVNKSFIVLSIGSPSGCTIGVSGFVNSTTVRFTMTSGPNPQNATVNFYVIELP